MHVAMYQLQVPEYLLHALHEKTSSKYNFHYRPLPVKITLSLIPPSKKKKWKKEKNKK
uniref:Uncharacterized protein n=1 Tax=Nelumbo nucifera TaxID=4432 RepID=A0A822YRZ6_NELNU|nr:TPA_asm: hypothetical protein HUJ06_010839 [Nelumbo nucifera]